MLLRKMTHHSAHTLLREDYWRRPDTANLIVIIMTWLGIGWCLGVLVVLAASYEAGAWSECRAIMWYCLP